MAMIEHHLDNLDEFWEMLSPVGSFVKSLRKPIFRGHGSDKWKLAPQVFRSFFLAKYLTVTEATTHTSLIFEEYRLLDGFLWQCDNIGYSIPNDSDTFRQAMSFDNFFHHYGISTENWPSSEYFHFLAFAQHHGMPTRLLDWTKNPLVAIYFALSQALTDNLNKENKLAIWILESDALNNNSYVKLLSLPGSTSANLAAQQGVFTFHQLSYEYGRGKLFVQSEIEELVHSQYINELTVHKITLGTEHIDELLMRCQRYGVSAATMFPTLEGAAKAALEWKLAHKTTGKL